MFKKYFFTALLCATAMSQASTTSTALNLSQKEAQEISDRIYSTTNLVVFSEISPELIPFLAPNKISWLSDRQIKAFTKDQIKALTSEQFKAFTPFQIPAFTQEQIEVFKPEQIGALNLSQIYAFTPNQFRYKSPELNSFIEEALVLRRIYNLAEDHPAATNQDDLNSLTEKAVHFLKPKQIGNISKFLIKHLNPEQLKYFKPEQIKYFKPEQFQYFKPEQIQALTSDQIKNLKLKQIIAITDKQLQAFLPAQFEDEISFEEFIRKAHEIKSLKFLHEQKIKALTQENMNNWTKNQIQGLTLTQLKHLIDHAKINFLTSDQLNHFTKEQLKFLNANWTPNNVNFPSEEKKSSVSRPTKPKKILFSRNNNLKRD